MGKRDYATLRKGFGLARGLGEEFVQACERNDVPIEAIHRLVTPQGRETMDEIARQISAAWLIGQRPEGGHPYRGGPTNGNAFLVPVLYVQPEFEELKRRFPSYVNPDYKGRRLDPIERCKAVSEENREVAFEYVLLDRDASTDEVLAEIDRKGLRPALYEELLGFAEKYPDEQWKYPIVALGSETLVHGYRNVAYLWHDDDGRSLYLSWIDDDWNVLYRFLAMRK